MLLRDKSDTSMDLVEIRLIKKLTEARNNC